MLNLKSFRSNYGIFRLGTQSTIAFYAQCCMNTKTSSKVTAYIPKDWTDLLGYSAEDIDKWVDMIQNGFNLALDLSEHIIQIDTAYKSYIGVKRPAAYVDPDHESLELNNSDYCQIDNDEFYIVRIDNSYSLKNYCGFVLLRYLWHHHYHPIVKKAFEIKERLVLSDNKDITAILMAHLFGTYDPYYSLLNSRLNRPEEYYKFIFCNPKLTWSNEGYRLNALLASSVYIKERNSAKINELVKANAIEELETYLYQTEQTPVKKLTSSIVKEVKSIF